MNLYLHRACMFICITSFLQIAGAMAEKSCTLQDTFTTAQLVADNIGWYIDCSK